MFKNKMTFLALAAVVLSVVTMGCASGVQTNPDATFPLEVTAEQPAFIFPISLHFGGSADKEKVNVALTAGVVAEFGTSVIGGQQLYDLVGNLSWTLGESMRRNVNNGTWEMTGSAKEYSDALAGQMEGILGALSGLGLIDPDFRFKYIIILHADGSSSMIPDTVAFYAFGGIYDIESNTILSYIEKEVTLADDENTMLVQIPVEFNEIVKQLIAGE